MEPGHSGTELKFVAEPFRTEKRGKKYDYIKLPNITVAGKNCEAYSMKSSAGRVIFAGWNNILLYSKTVISIGEMQIKAVEIRENANVDASMFKVPGGYAVKNM